MRRVLLLGGCADGEWVNVTDSARVVRMDTLRQFQLGGLTSLEPTPVHEYRIERLHEQGLSFWVGVQWTERRPIFEVLMSGYKKGGA